MFSWALLFLPGCSKEEIVTTEKLEYRKDKNGVVRLYSAGNDDPVGRWKFARVTENYPSGQKKFEIGIVDGLRHGSFFFWQPNGLKKLTGSFEKGKREGTFTSYGRAGEILYQKNYFEDELEGNLSLYYSLTNAEVFRYFEKTREEGLDVGDIPVTSNIRLEATFSKGIPVGPYRTYYHPRGQTGLSREDLLEEEGRFDEKGRLIGNQVCYYPRTGGSLFIYLMTNLWKQSMSQTHTDCLKQLTNAIWQSLKSPPIETPRTCRLKCTALITGEEKSHPSGHLRLLNLRCVITGEIFCPTDMIQTLNPTGTRPLKKQRMLFCLPIYPTIQSCLP